MKIQPSLSQQVGEELGRITLIRKYPHGYGAHGYAPHVFNLKLTRIIEYQKF